MAAANRERLHLTPVLVRFAFSSSDHCCDLFIFVSIEAATRAFGRLHAARRHGSSRHDVDRNARRYNGESLSPVAGQALVADGCSIPNGAFGLRGSRALRDRDAHRTTRNVNLSPLSDCEITRTPAIGT